jgi:hypothetical protein
MFEMICKHGQTQRVERYYDRERDQNSFFWGGDSVCILVQAMHTSSFGQLQQLVHELWGFLRGPFFSVTLLCRKPICTCLFWAVPAL